MLLSTCPSLVGPGATAKPGAEKALRSASRFPHNLPEATSQGNNKHKEGQNPTMSASPMSSPPQTLRRPPSNRSVQSQSNFKTALGRIPVPAQLMEGLPVMKVNSVRPPFIDLSALMPLVVILVPLH